MPRSSTISSKGQITVPREIRKRMGLRTGDRVEFAIEDGKAVLRPASAEENPFLQFIGARPGFRTLRQIHAWTRSLRDEE